MSFNMNDLDLHFTYCSKSQWMEIMPVPTCCKLHAHNYTCIPKTLGRRGTLDPTGQLVSIISPNFLEATLTFSVLFGLDFLLTSPQSHKLILLHNKSLLKNHKTPKNTPEQLNDSPLKDQPSISEKFNPHFWIWHTGTIIVATMHNTVHW